MPSADFEIGSEPSRAFLKAEELVLGKKYRIVHRIKDSHIEATGLRNLNGILFAILILGQFGSLLYTFSDMNSPWFVVALILDIVFAIMILIAYFSSPWNRIYLDIARNGRGTYTVNLTAVGENASELMKAMNSSISSNDNGPKSSENGQA